MSSPTDPANVAARLGPLGAALPQVGAGGIRRTDHADFAQHAEQAGYLGLWTCELTAASILDPLILLAHAAATTEHAMLGIAVVLAPLRTPLLLANQLATLDVVSGGRLAVGFGFGSNPAIYSRYGLSPDKRLTRYLDTIDLVKKLWSHDELDFDNGIWKLEGPTNVVTPIQQPNPPLFIGARQSAAVERCARIGDGWVVSGSAPPEEVATGKEMINRTLDEIGRERDHFTVAQRVYIAIDNNHDRGMSRLADWFGTNYGKPAIAEKSGIVGSVDQIADHVARLRASGVDHVILNPVFDEADQLDSYMETVGVEA